MTILKKLHIAPDNNSNTNNDNIYNSNTNPNTNNNNNNSDTNNNNINNCDINTNSNTPNKMLLLLGSYIEDQPLQHVQHLSLFEDLSAELHADDEFGKRYGAEESRFIS